MFCYIRKISYLCKRFNKHMFNFKTQIIMVIVSVRNENGKEERVIKTNVPVEKIVNFLRENAKKNKEDEIIAYIKSKYPFLAFTLKEGGILDAALAGGIRDLAKATGVEPKDVVDDVDGLINGTFLYGIVPPEIGGKVAAGMLVASRENWIKSHK